MHGHHPHEGYFIAVTDKGVEQADSCMGCAPAGDGAATRGLAAAMGGGDAGAHAAWLRGVEGPRAAAAAARPSGAGERAALPCGVRKGLFKSDNHRGLT